MLTAIIGLICASYSTEYYMLALSLFSCGFGGGCFVVTYDLLGEITPNSKRFYTTILFQYSWDFGGLYVSLCAYSLLQYGWRYLVRACAIPGIIGTIFLWLFIYESPRWYLSQNRVKEAEYVMKNIRDFYAMPATLDNQSTWTSANVILMANMKESEDAHGNVLELFTPSTFTRVLPLWCSYFQYAFILYGISYVAIFYFHSDSDDDSDDDTDDSCKFEFNFLFIYTMGSFIANVFSCLPMYLFREWKISLAIFFGIATITTTLFAAIGETSLTVGWVLLFITNIFQGSGTNIIWSVSLDYFPTELRNAGHSIGEKLQYLVVHYSNST